MAKELAIYDKSIDFIEKALNEEIKRRATSNPITNDYIWKTKDNKLVHVSDMTTNHLYNLYNMVTEQLMLSDCIIDKFDWDYLG